MLHRHASFIAQLFNCVFLFFISQRTCKYGMQQCVYSPISSFHDEWNVSISCGVDLSSHMPQQMAARLKAGLSVMYPHFTHKAEHIRFHKWQQRCLQVFPWPWALQRCIRFCMRKKQAVKWWDDREALQAAVCMCIVLWECHGKVLAVGKWEGVGSGLIKALLTAGELSEILQYWDFFQLVQRASHSEC